MRSGFAVEGAILLRMPALALQRRDNVSAMEARLLDPLPFCPSLRSFGVASMPEPARFGTMPFSSLFTSPRADNAGISRLGFLVVLGGVHALQIGEHVVGGVVVPVVDMAARRYLSEGRAPNIAMQFLAAARVIDLARPKTVETAIEILRERVKDDWTNEPVCRLSADFHPLSVMNK